MKEIEFINNRMSGKKVEVPQFLYKYRPFDEFAFDMLEKGYVYLCPAEKLDDPSECKSEISINDFYIQEYRFDFGNGQTIYYC